MKNDHTEEIMDDCTEQFGNDSTWRWPWLAVGALLGLGVMYWLDPSQGRRRRSRLAERWNTTAVPMGKAISSEVRRRSNAVFHGHH